MRKAAQARLCDDQIHGCVMHVVTLISLNPLLVHNNLVTLGDYPSPSILFAIGVSREITCTI